jgi:hypothetical protein
VSVLWLQVSLRGMAGERATGSLLFELLALRAEDGFEVCPSDSPWKAARIVLFQTSMESVAAEAGKGEPTELFAARIQEGFLRAARWSGRARRAGLISAARRASSSMCLLEGGWTTSSSISICLPSSC